MRIHAFGLSVALVIATFVTGANAKPVRVPMGAKVTTVDLVRQRATIDRGTKAGVRVGEIGELFAMRGSPVLTVSFDERVARGKVVEAKATTAVIALDAIADTLEVGAYYRYTADAPEDLASSPLFNVVALGVELSLQYKDKVLISTEDMLGDPSQARRDKALDAMIDEMRTHKAFFDSKISRIDGGKHHGKSGGKVIDELTRAELLEFFLFVEGYSSSYLTVRLKVPEIYFAWVLNGTLSGARERKLRVMQPVIAAAGTAASTGKLDEARTQWEAVLREIPDHKEASAEVERIYKLQLWMRELAADPDDTKIRDQLAHELFEIRAFALALPQVDLLVKARYEPYDTAKFRAKILAQLKNWREAEAGLERLAKERPDDTDVQTWIEYVKIKARLDRDPDDPAARLALAEHAYRGNSWDWALQELRRVIEAKRVTNMQRGTVKRMQRRIGLQHTLDEQLGWARESIASHNIAAARRNVDESVKLLDQLGDPARASTVLEELASAAHMRSEIDFEMELYQRRAERTQDDSVVNSLAFALVEAGRYDEAAAAANRATNPSPYVLAMVARASGDLVEVERIASKTEIASPKAAWPKEMLAAVEAARGNWQEAVEYVRAAQLIDSDVRVTLNAALRGLQAHEALLANPSSARERLRLVRALANLRLVKATTAEIAKLPPDGTWRSEGWWAITASEDLSIPLIDQLVAARNAKPTTPARKRVLARLEAEVKLRGQPKDEATRIALANLYVQSGSDDLALAVLGPLLVAPVKSAVADVANVAREALGSSAQSKLVYDAIDREDYASAMRTALVQRALADHTGDVLFRGSAREAIMNIFVAQGRYAEAIATVEEASAIVRADGDPWLTLIGDWHVAEIRGHIGTNEIHRRSLTAGLKICDDLDNDTCLFMAHREIAALAFDDGSYADGIDHARAAWTLADRLGDVGRARAARIKLANLDLAAGRRSDAEQLLIPLLVDSRKAVDTTHEQYTLMMLGILASQRGQGSVARERYQEVYDLGTRIGYTPWRAQARKLEGAAWLDADHDFVKAEKASEQAAALFDGPTDKWSIDQHAAVLRQLASARLKQHKTASARQAAEQALALEQKNQHRSSLASTHAMLARIAIDEKVPGPALASANAALDLAKQTDEVELLTETWSLLAEARVLNNQDTEAAAAYDKALEYRARALLAVGGESDRDNYLATGDSRDLYVDAVELYLKLGNTTRAMEVLDQSRDAQLKQAFDPATVQTADPKLRARLDKYETERAHVKALQQQLEDAANKPGAQRSEAQVKAIADLVSKSEQSLKAVAADLKGDHQVLYRVMAVDPQRLIDRRDQLPPGAIVVEYFSAADALYVFVISAALKQPAVVRVKVTSAQLLKTVTDFREAIVQEAGKLKSGAKVEALGRKLEDWLLEPLHKHLEGASTVIIVPFGPLYYVPFDALVVSEAGKPVRYAVEDYRISIQTAMTIERLLEPARPRTTGSLLAIANPDGSLPGAEREVVRIVKTIPDARVFRSKTATLKKFTDVVGGSRYIHIASHGILDPDPWKSFLKLADANLTVSMIAKLDGLRTSTELVVLSACESATAQATSTSTDDPMSLAGGFAWAGAPAIVASLWQVDDESTAELMATFYRALQANTADRLESLRNAKLNILRFKQGKVTPYSAPWHWASFQLYGDFRAPATLGLVGQPAQ